MYLFFTYGWKGECAVGRVRSQIMAKSSWMYPEEKTEPQKPRWVDVVRERSGVSNIIIRNIQSKQLTFQRFALVSQHCLGEIRTFLVRGSVISYCRQRSYKKIPFRMLLCLGESPWLTKVRWLIFAWSVYLAAFAWFMIMIFAT